jgi:hypothetical protein
LPLHLEGDDGLIGALVKWDLDPTNNAFDDDRIAPCPDAGYAFDSMSLHRYRDWKAYWARTVRYARGRYEFELLGRRLRRLGIAGMPVDIRELYHEASGLTPRPGALGKLTSWLALRRMRDLASGRATDCKSSTT